MNDQKPMRTRIAPSPTGYMHIGTLRTMLYDYFLARQSGGQFILRIEDTDQERLVPGTLEAVLDMMMKVGLDYDEGPVLLADGTLGEKGSYGPYVQSKRLEIYQKYVEQLLQSGHAYRCFCSHEDLERMRAEQQTMKLPPKYNRHCLGLSSTEVERLVLKGDSSVIRLKVPSGDESRFVDAIRGEIVFQNDEVDDQVLLKSDGFPTYHLAVVVDDYLMQITHVLRGEEWISSMPKQIILAKALGFELPVYAHVPLILNPDKTKLSKRKGDVSVESFIEQGYLPSALLNFLALLGWNPTADREIYPLTELVDRFDLSKVNKAGAILNLDKLNWMNGQYLKVMSEQAYLDFCRPFVSALNCDQKMLDRACLVMRERLHVPTELISLIEPLIAESLAYEIDLVCWKGISALETAERLKAIFIEIVDWHEAIFAEASLIEEKIRAMIVDHGWGNGDTLWPLRVSLSGQKQSPSPFELLWMLGRNVSLRRIDDACARLLS